MTRISLFFLVLMLSLKGTCQRLHINYYLGTANYQGDLLFGQASTKRYSLDQARLSGGINLEYQLSNHFSIRGGVMAGKIGGDDKKSLVDVGRNLNFTSAITEGMVGLQYYITNPDEHFMNFYAFTGVAIFHFNPYTKDSSGQKVFLRPLSTEGQGFIAGKKPYSLYQPAIAFGGGVKFSLGENLRVGGEVGIRRTFTDYIDDVSTEYVDQSTLLLNRGQLAVDLAYRGDELKNGSPYPAGGTPRGLARFKDWYYFTNVVVSFRLGNGFRKSGRSKIGCPVRVY